MKKIRLLCTALIAMLCFTVLGVGIYAASPASNTITGNVTVVGAAGEVEIKIYKYANGTESLVDSGGTTRTGSNLTLSYGLLTFDASSANTIGDVPLQEIRIKIKNKSTVQDLGAYFSTQANATASTPVATPTTNPATSTVKYGSIAENDYLSYEYAFYNHLPKKVGNTETEITMSIYVRVTQLPESNSAVYNTPIPIYLVIESYEANYTSSATGFVKVGTNHLSSGNMPTTWASGVNYVVLPYGTTGVDGYYEPKGDAGSYFPSSLVTVTIPSTVTSIGYYCFYGVTSLKSIFIPNTVTNIDFYCFYNNTNLTYVTFPNSLNFISHDNFSGCTNLNYYVYNNGYYLGTLSNNYYLILKAINTSITSCVVQNDTKYIYNNCFSGCSSLVNLTIPSGIEYVGGGCFTGCSSLSYNEYSNAYYLGNSTNNYVLLVKAKNTSISTCTINANTKFIGYGAFNACSSISTITIPSNVINIYGQHEDYSDYYVFYNSGLGTWVIDSPTFASIFEGWYGKNPEKLGGTVKVLSSITNISSVILGGSYQGIVDGYKVYNF